MSAPSNKATRLDDSQRIACGMDGNVVVSAGAGSGKTTVLAERYVRLVTQRGLGVDEILTLTFTRKAQAEMYARIYKRLSETDHPRAQEQLARFDAARISTLDSFCAAIARSACHRYGVPPDFTVDDQRLKRVAEETAVELLMEHRDARIIRRQVATKDFDTVVKDLFADIALRHMGLVGAPEYSLSAGKQIEYIKIKMAQACTELNDLGDRILAIDETGSKGESLAKAKSAIEQRLPLDIRQAAENPADAEEIADFYTSKDSFSRPGNVTQASLVELKELAGPFKETAKLLGILAATLGNRDDILEMGALLDEYALRFLGRKRREGLLSFNDTAEMAVDILVSIPELRTHYKKQLKAIMIDEFQDNNELQKKLLFLLAERTDRCVQGIPRAADLAPDKLFFVGDEKQSIYRFRGADVSVFRRLAEELDSLSLGTNYRSSLPLVRFFNDLFPGVFGPAQEDYEAAFSGIGASPNQVEADSNADGKAAGPAVEFHIYDTALADAEDGEEERETLSACESAAFAIARRIIEGVGSGDFALSDVAMLFRSTTHQGVYERTFRRIGLPFVAADPRGVYAEGPANDLYAMLRLVLFPGDRNAYATVLRSPFVRLGDDAFTRIMLDAIRKPFPDEAPSHWFADQFDGERFGQGRILYAELCRRADKEGIASILAFLWYGSGYRSRLQTEASARSCLEHFEYLYGFALDADRRHVCLGGFLDEMAPLMGSSEKAEGGEAGKAAEAISFMTIHKSKGLEFPVVILPDAGTSAAADRNAKPYFMDRDFGPAVNLKSERKARNHRALNYFYERNKEEDKKQAWAELKRLFYVAATRAERRLIIFGARKLNKKESGSLEGLSDQDRPAALLAVVRQDTDGEASTKTFLDLIALGLSTPQGKTAQYKLFPVPSLELLEKNRRYAELEQLFRQSNINGRDPKANPEALLEDFFALPPKAIPLEPSRLISPTRMESLRREEKKTKAEQLPTLDVDDLLGKHRMESAFGTLCHGNIERLLAGLPPNVPKEVEIAFRNSNMEQGDRTKLLRRALGLAEDFFKSPFGAQARSAPRRRAEFPFLLPLPDSGAKPMLVQGIIDLLYEFDGRCIILDFKTDRGFEPEAHQVQLDAYRLAAAAFSDLPVETWLVYLRGMRPVRLDQALGAQDIALLAEAALGEDERTRSLEMAT